MVAQALGSGVFTDIEGNVQSLEDALINFADETGELFGVMGTVIKSELITNLQIAQQAVKDLDEIIQGLDLEKYATVRSSTNLSQNMVSGSAVVYSSNANGASTPEIRFDSPIINIEGNVDRDVLSDLESYGEKLTKDIIDKIATAIR